MDSLALVDLDGVLADDRHRVQFAIQKDWDTYFDPDRILADDPWREGQEMVERLVSEGHEVQYLTGRWSSLRTVTEEWLDRNEFPMRRLTMREPLWRSQGLSEHAGWPSMRQGRLHRQGAVQRRLRRNPHVRRPERDRGRAGTLRARERHTLHLVNQAI